MPELRHLISLDSLDKLQGLQLLAGDPLTFHKTKFVKYLEARSDELYSKMIGDGMEPEEALSATRQLMFDLTSEWKAVARTRHVAS